MSEEAIETSEPIEVEEAVEALGTDTPELEPTDQDPPAQEDEVTEPPDEAAYSPDFKFKVYDEEKEMDEWLRPLIKDKETEDRFRDIMARAHGLDKMKEYRDKAREDLEEHKGHYETQTNAIKQLSNYLQTGDYEQFFHSLDIPLEVLTQFVLQKAEYSQNYTPQQKAAYDAQLADRRRASTLEQQYSDTNSKLEAMQQQQVVNEFNAEISKPEVSAFKEAFDQRNGSGAFQEEIAKQGQYHEVVNNQVLPISQLVTDFMTRFGGPSQSPTAQAGVVPQVAQPQDLPVLPNTGASGGRSPTIKAIKSLEDLEKLASEM